MKLVAVCFSFVFMNSNAMGDQCCPNVQTFRGETKRVHLQNLKTSELISRLDSTSYTQRTLASQLLRQRGRRNEQDSQAIMRAYLNPSSLEVHLRIGEILRTSGPSLARYPYPDRSFNRSNVISVRQLQHSALGYLAQVDLLVQRNPLLLTLVIRYSNQLNVFLPIRTVGSPLGRQLMRIHLGSTSDTWNVIPRRQAEQLLRQLDGRVRLTVQGRRWEYADETTYEIHLGPIDN